ncbi:hypothetical protein THASP1DRAFT_29128 [Thamnocephalis sphaerospora]|uniref:Uncharacterized protein n=1 Tax=Thamnocephalis sphaerospora TaxID=78915 RepID=A0A4P9XU20_9FUNG|nr:hypothetical protein THASP1DRAFT_29128 [Thamnocephalis sphaerospora]|eukprot:RKP09071.1 hypothetical protein THASP1DRAFT_29128 [Thamnocephalis sphaerospora]
MPMQIDENGTCHAVIATQWLLAKFVTDITGNVILSGLYLYVLGQAFRAGFSASLYDELRHEGFIATFLIIVSSTTTAVIVLLDLVPNNAVYVYGIDTLINATLINRMLCRHRNNGSQTRSANDRQRLDSIDE